MVQPIEVHVIVFFCTSCSRVGGISDAGFGTPKQIPFASNRKTCHILLSNLPHVGLHRLHYHKLIRTVETESTGFALNASQRKHAFPPVFWTGGEELSAPHNNHAGRFNIYFYMLSTRRFSFCGSQLYVVQSAGCSRTLIRPAGIDCGKMIHSRLVRLCSGLRKDIFFTDTWVDLLR